ncbi:hypothetical protein IV203_017197 [Nitzschia inconspicua]|uniref:Uncharacterized protein n=1 Tax=Nitzschia inconspicua TaxID=303405 RepID=A0A9K3PI41_9STRA|nr:hypothetical protein IV203_017197 [Nitzschia inconspicua]
MDSYDNNNLTSSIDLWAELAQLLMEFGFCSDIDEARVIAEVVLDNRDQMIIDINSKMGPYQIDSDSELSSRLVENVGVEEEEANVLIGKLMGTIQGTINKDDPSLKKEEIVNDVSIDDEQSDDTEYLQDGECELCDRFIKLTKHHLIPRETWSRIQPKLLHAAEAKEKGDIEKAVFVLGPGLCDVLEKLSTERSTIKRLLRETCDICRQCHSAIHRTHTNLELALNYNTVQKLLEDENIRKFCLWASKQRPGKYKR